MTSTAGAADAAAETMGDAEEGVAAIAVPRVAAPRKSLRLSDDWGGQREEIDWREGWPTAVREPAAVKPKPTRFDIFKQFPAIIDYQTKRVLVSVKATTRKKICLGFKKLKKSRHPQGDSTRWRSKE